MILTPSSESLTKHFVPPVPIPPGYVVQHIGKTGKDVLWIAFVVFVVATLLMGVMAIRHEKRHRLFHWLFIMVAIVASLSYYAMAVGNGYKYVDLGAYNRDGRVVEIYRQIFWVRRVDWAITTPLLLLSLLLLAGVSWANIIVALIANEAAILTDTFAVFHPGRGGAKWGWLVFSCLFLAYVLKELLYTGFKACRNRHPSLFKLYRPLAILASLIWVMYTFFSVLTEATGVVSVNWEVGLYAILDILAKAGLGMIVLSVHRPSSSNACAAIFPDSFVEERGTTAGPIQLPVGE